MKKSITLMVFMFVSLLASAQNQQYSVICPNCGGDGCDPSGRTENVLGYGTQYVQVPKSCNRCYGNGSIRVPQSQIAPKYRNQRPPRERVRCFRCNGTGYDPRYFTTSGYNEYRPTACHVCSGVGSRKVKDKYDLRY